jgi:hypothetical protein
MRRSLILCLLVAGCGGSDPSPKPSEEGRPFRPGETASLAEAMSAALGCPAADLTWTALDGGSVTPAGVFTVPACGAATFPATYHVEAKGCGKSATVTVPVQEAVTAIRICGGDVAVAPGAVRQFYAEVTYSCPGHVEYSPSTPPVGTCF